MEKSITEEVEPVQSLKTSAMFTAACGFALYWACFFTMLMRNSFMDAAIEELWYHLFLRIVFLAGSTILCIVIARKADWFSSEFGRRVQKSGVVLFCIVAASSSFTAYKVASVLPLAFDLIAWSLAGIGLSFLLMIWVETLSSFTPKELIPTLIGSMALGAVIYLVMNVLTFPFNISLLCLLPLGSMGVSSLIENDTDIKTAGFVPLAESRRRARLSSFFKGISILYGVVFGLGIGSTTQIDGNDFLYTGIALILALGAACAFLTLRSCVDYIQRRNSMRLLFPVLIVALIPMSFFQGTISVICNLILLGCFVFFEAISIDLALFLAQYKKASQVHLVGSSQACLYAGLALGHTTGLIATYSGVMDYSMLSMVTLGLVVVLAIVITFAPLSPLTETPSKDSFFADDGSEDPAANPLSGDGSSGEGRWRTRCKEVALNAGLSARETEVFMLLAKGRGIEHIQNKLCISGHTVKTHVYNIYKKMGINSREELLDSIEAKPTFETKTDH